VERKRRKIGDDELSQAHSSLIDLEANPVVPISVEIDQKIRDLQGWLMRRGWPDPLAILVLRNGEFDGETLDEPRS
jgi:hypothetical protein